MKKMVLLPGLLKAFVTCQTLFMFVNSAPMSCLEAHEKLDDESWTLCRIGVQSLTTDEKLTGQCDPECQALFTSVIESCQIGDTVDEYINLRVPYQPAFLFHEFHQNTFYSTWASCDFGYQPTKCDIAYGNLHISRSSGQDGPQIIYNEDACLSESNESQCSPECKSFIDQVVIHCDTPEQTTFSPNDNFFDLTHTVLQWNHIPSMTRLLFNPSNYFAPEPLSETCWQYYETKAEEQSPTSIRRPTAPSDPYYKECLDAFMDVQTSVACGSGNQCSTSCQVLIDRVDDTCSEGDNLILHRTGAYLEYKESTLYHSLAFDESSPISLSCQFGKFQPTACDIAYGKLLRNLDFDGICNADSEANTNSSTCAPDCRSIVEQIVNDCDVPANSTFSPGYYFDTDQKYEVISWAFPDSMENTGFIWDLSESCWEFYKEKGELVRNDDILPDTPREQEVPETKGPTATPSQAPQSPAVSLPEITTAPTSSPQQLLAVTKEPTTSSPTANLVNPQTSSPVVEPTTDTSLVSAAVASRGWFLLWATLASSILVSALW